MDSFLPEMVTVFLCLCHQLLSCFMFWELGLDLLFGRCTYRNAFGSQSNCHWNDFTLVLVFLQERIQSRDRSQASSRQQAAKFICKASTLWAWSGPTRGWVSAHCLWDPGVLSCWLGYAPLPPFLFFSFCTLFSSWCICASRSVWVCNRILMLPLGYLWGAP